MLRPAAPLLPALPSLPLPALGPAVPVLNGFLEPTASQVDVARSEIKRWHTGPGTHGTAPNCDWGWTGPNCERPLCGAYHWPSIEKWAARTGNTCAQKPDKNVGGKSLGLHAKLRRIGDSMHIPEHWMREDWIWLLTVLAALAILRKNAQFIITLGILQLLMKLS